jgi:protein TonB
MVVPVDQDLDPDPTAFAPLPPAPTVETESKPTAPPTNSPEPWPTEPEPSAVTGDGSSPLPGQDVTTAPGALVTTASPDYRRNPEPEYPLPARRRGQEGLVVLEVTVSGVGQATAVALKQSSGYALLDQAAMQAVKHWEFEPARIGAVGVESRIEVPVRFRLSP